jgi:hypothetical protein
MAENTKLARHSIFPKTCILRILPLFAPLSWPPRSMLKVNVEFCRSRRIPRDTLMIGAVHM